MQKLWQQTKWTIPLLVTVLIGLILVCGVQFVREATLPKVDLHTQVPAVEAATTAPNKESLRFAVASMVSAEQTFSMYQRLVQRIGRDAGREDVFVLRPSYSDVRQSLEKSQVDVAFVCTGTYVHTLANQTIKLLAQPVFEKGQQYRCLVIVPAESPAQSITDLTNKVMAFTDRESNTGCLVPSHLLFQLGYDPETFFQRIIYTGSHDRSIVAVGRKIVDVACIDSLIWYSKLRSEPELKDRIRVIWQSEAFGPPPIVVPANIDPVLEQKLQTAFLNLHQDEEGRAILSGIGIAHFIKPKPENYMSAIALYRELKRDEKRP
jgi:phosphonate transport system substrate-binding protein